MAIKTPYFPPGFREVDGQQLNNLAASLQIQNICAAASDETTDLTTGANKVKFRAPYGFKITDIRASLSTAATGASLLTVDVNKNGVSILSTKLTFTSGATTTLGAATPAVLSDTVLADDDELEVDIDQVGSTTTGRGLKVMLIGYRQ